MGSVKDLVVIRKPTSKKAGTGKFVFSDRYSVFDYGEMPDKIDGKGSSLCIVSAYFFEMLEREGIETHYKGLLQKGKLKKLDEIDEPVNEMQVKLVRVLRPKKTKSSYDYSIFNKEKTNYLIPLEVIYRNVLPEGSSVFRRLESGELSPEALGLKQMPVPGEILERPIIDFSTKLEDGDRYIPIDEAKEISGLGERIDEVIEIVQKVNSIISDEVSKAGIVNEDGKIELALDDKGEIIIVDSVGTLDECRFRLDGIELSKEILRKHYRKTYWYKRLKVTKGTENWRKVLGSPPKLPEKLKNTVSNMYKAYCNEIIGMKLFDVPKLREIVKELRDLM